MRTIPCSVSRRRRKRATRPEADAEAEGASPPAEGEGVEGAEGEAPAKKKMSGKKLIPLHRAAGLYLCWVAAALRPSCCFRAASNTRRLTLAITARPKVAEVTALRAKAKLCLVRTARRSCTREDVIFVTMPELLVNISGADGRPAYLKLKLTLEVPDDAAVTALTEHIPRVNDQFNTFLRELRTDDISGSAGAYRLRLELLRRVNLAIAPAQVNAVLIEEMLVQ